MGDTARGLRILRLMLTTAMVVPTPATAMAVLAMAMVAMGTARGLPTLRLMPTTAMAVMVDTDSVMAATAMVVLATVMARGLLTLRPMPTTAMAVMVDTDLDMAAMAVSATVMARGLLMPSLTMVDMVGPTLVLDTATEAMVELSVDTATWDKEFQGCSRELQPMKFVGSSKYEKNQFAFRNIKSLRGE